MLLPIFAPSRGVITNGLQLWLDAKDYVSGQLWEDRTINGYDFYLGSGSGSDAADPSRVSGPPAYWSFDGGDRFTSAAAYSGTLPRLAGRSDTPFTLEAWLYRGATANTNEVIFSNMSSGSSSNGFAWAIDGDSNKPQIYAQSAWRGAGTNQAGVGAWIHAALAGRFNGSTCTHYLNAAANGTFTYTESVFTSGDSAGVAKLGTQLDGSASAQFQNGTRLAVVRAYDRVLTAAEIANNFAVERPYFGV